jgi:hypothetical protein
MAAVMTGRTWLDLSWPPSRSKSLPLARWVMGRLPIWA